MSTQRRDCDWRRLHGVGLFLSCFRAPHTLQEVVAVVDWKLNLRWEPELVVEHPVAAGLLEPAEPTSSPKDRLGRFLLPELQAMARRHGMAVSGAKQDLIERLIGHDAGDMERVALHRTLLHCTDEGARITAEYLARGVGTLAQQRSVPLDVAAKVVKWILVADYPGVPRIELLILAGHRRPPTTSPRIPTIRSSSNSYTNVSSSPAPGNPSHRPTRPPQSPRPPRRHRGGRERSLARWRC